MAQWFPELDEAYHDTASRVDASFGTADPTAVFDPDREFGFDLIDAEDPESSVFVEDSRTIQESMQPVQEAVDRLESWGTNVSQDFESGTGAVSKWARLLEWLANHPTTVVAFLAVVLLAPILGPAAEIGANLTED